jgi:hypothetical protein
MAAEKKEGFWRHPLTITLISVILGSWMFGWVMEKKREKDSKQEQKIIFLNETGKDLQKVFSYLNGIIYEEAIDDYDVCYIDTLIGIVHDNHMNVNIKSIVYLSDTTFNITYGSIEDELDNLDEYLTNIKNKRFDTVFVSNELATKISTLEKKWNIEADTIKIEHKYPYKELSIITGLIEKKSENIIIDELKRTKCWLVFW